MSLVSLLIAVILICVIIYVVQMMPLPAPWKQIVTIIVCLIIVVWLLESLGVVHLR